MRQRTVKYGTHTLALKVWLALPSQCIYTVYMNDTNRTRFQVERVAKGTGGIDYEVWDLFENRRVACFNVSAAACATSATSSEHARQRAIACARSLTARAS